MSLWGQGRVTNGESLEEWLRAANEPDAYHGGVHDAGSANTGHGSLRRPMGRRGPQRTASVPQWTDGKPGEHQRSLLCKVKLAAQQVLNQDGALLGQRLWDLGHRGPA